MTRNARRPDQEEGRYAVPEAEVEAWAAEERRRRQAWLEGPSEEEKQAWAERERRRRLRALSEEREVSEIETAIGEGRRASDKLQHELSLALAGAASQLLTSPYRFLGSLMRAGRELEDEYYTPRRRRPRVPLDIDER